MSFPEWGFSYNALYVPLSVGWQCALMPAHEMQEVDRGWSLSFEERKRKKKERAEQIEEDRQDFDRLFRVGMNRREARTSSDFREYLDFISRNLRLSGWDLLDGDGITRALRNAARDGRIIPVISRKWFGSHRIFKHYAPQRWPTNGGTSGGQRASEVLDWRAFAALKRANGEHGFGSGVAASDFNKARNIAPSAGGGESSSFDWIRVIESAGGAVAGAASGDSDGNRDSILKSLGDADETSLFADARPFEYESKMPDGEVFDLAKTPNAGEPGTWYTNSGSGQMRLYDDGGQPIVDLDFDHDHGQGVPHAHNWSIDPLTGKNSRGSGVSFSILP